MALFPFDHHHYGHSLLPFGSAAAFPSFPAHHAPFAAPFHGFPSAELSAPRAAATQPEGWNAWAPWGGATAWPTATTAPTPTPASSLHAWGAPPAQAEAWGAPPVGTAPASAPANVWGENPPAAPAAAEEPAQAEVEEAPAEAAEDEGPVRLTYFAGRGLAEATRLLLEEAGVPYEEVNVQSKEGWDELKPTLRYGQLPTLDIDGLRLYQSKAIARYVARKYGFYGHDNAEQTGIDEILEAETDMWRDNPVQALAGMAPSDPEQLAKHVETYTTKLHKYLTVFENMLKTMAELDPEPLYFVGQRFTLADAAVFHDINMLTAFPQFADILQEYPHLQRWHTGIAQRPRIAEYMASERCHPWPPTPEFLQMVKAIFAK